MVSTFPRLLCVCVCLLWAACESRVTPQRQWQPSDHGQPAQADSTRAAPQPAAPEEGGVERAAAALWTVSCAGCHGRDGRGQGSARPPGAQVPDFTTGELAKRSDAELLEVITNGRGMMPAFSKQINAQGLQALVAHVRGFAPKQ